MFSLHSQAENGLVLFLRPPRCAAHGGDYLRLKSFETAMYFRPVKTSSTFPRHGDRLDADSARRIAAEHGKCVNLAINALPVTFSILVIGFLRYW